MATISDRPTVFISYSHKDEEWKERLVPVIQAAETIVETLSNKNPGTYRRWLHS